MPATDIRYVMPVLHAIGTIPTDPPIWLKVKPTYVDVKIKKKYIYSKIQSKNHFTITIIANSQDKLLKLVRLFRTSLS